MADHTEVRARGPRRRRPGEQLQRPSGPGKAQHRREGGHISSGGLQDRHELGLDDEQEGILGAGIGPLWVAHHPDQPLPSGQAAAGAPGEVGVRPGEEPGHVVEARSLAGLGRVADEHRELVGVVTGGFDREPRPPPNHRAGAHEQLAQDGERVGLGVGGGHLDDGPGQAVVDAVGGLLRPSRRGREARGGGEHAGHSASISAAAIRAEDSSTTDFPSA